MLPPTQRRIKCKSRTNDKMETGVRKGLKFRGEGLRFKVREEFLKKRGGL